MKKLNTCEFIERSNKVHNNKYDYNLVNYKNTRTIVKIICKKCGEFEQLPWVHLKGHGCSKCQNLTTEKFIDKSNDTHKNKYIYDRTKIINHKSKVIIKCKKHGYFEQSPGSHMNGSGCPKCFIDRKTSNSNEFIKKSNKIHNDKYDYSLVNYENVKTKVSIICKEHGIFEQKPGHHLNGHGCPKCVRIIDTDNFIYKSNKKHNNTYDYSNTIYKNHKTKVSIICKKHDIFFQSPLSHLRGIGCPICNQSKGEKRIYDNLNKKNITFITQYKFKNCKNKNPLPFDFYLPDHNICIEYNGIQHYKPIEFFGGVESLNELKIRDNIKKDFCNKNNINLIIIKYNKSIKKQIDNISIFLPSI